MGRLNTKAEEALPHWVNASQAIVLGSYCNGEFSHLLDCKSADSFDAALQECGDGLLKFMVRELAESEGVDGLEEGLRRLMVAVDQLGSVADGMASRLFSESVG